MTVIGILVKQTGERIVAKEKTALEEIQKLQAEFEEKIASKREAALEELRSDLSEARKVVKDIESQIGALGGTKRKTGTRVCQVCGQPGHNARRHTAAEKAAAKKKAS